jgi:hypothetical protein
MADWPLYGNQSVLASGISAVTTAVSVTCGVANTKTTTAVQLLAKTPFSACGIYVHFRVRTSAQDYMVDILQGAAGSEQVLLPNLSIGGATNTTGIINYYFPIRIAEGTRLSIKAQSSAVSPTITTVLHLIPDSFLGTSGLTRVEAVGPILSTTRGVALTIPGTADTYPAWVKIGAAPGGFTTRYVVVMLGQQGVTSRTTGQRFTSQWAIGDVGSEQVFLDGWPYGTTSSTSILVSAVGFPIEIAAGTFLHGRYTSSALTTLGADGIIYCCG